MARTGVKAYLWTFAALMVLVVVTVGASLVQLGMLAGPIALLIASIKAVLIIIIFMHVRDEPPLVGAFAGVGFVFLALLIVVTLGDYVTRRDMLEPAAAHEERSAAPVPISQ